MEDRPEDFRLEPLHGVIHADAPTIHHVQGLATVDGLRIVTSPEPWAYAVSFAVAADAARIEGRILIRVTGWVGSGRVGIGLVTSDGRTYLGEVFRGPHDGLTQFDLWTDSLTPGQTLVVRNAAGHASTITLESVRAYRCLTAPSTVDVHWIERRRSRVPLDGEGRQALAAAGTDGDGDLAPRISLVLTVKNGMPYLPEAIGSLRAQRYRNFELIVQDGGSSDGTLEYLRAITDIPTDIASAPDTGIGEARHRAYARCRTDIVGSIDADNVLKPDALSTAVAIFRDHPEAAAVYGAVEMIHHDGRFHSHFVPPEFDLLKVVSCELVPPWSTAFFSRRICGSDLFFDAAIPGCVDYDSWLRLGHLPILRIDRVLGCTRLSGQSVSCRIENYDAFCEEKITALERYLRQHAAGPLGVGLLRHGMAGIYCWAAESLQRLGAERSAVDKYVDLALRTDPTSERAQRLRAQAAPH